MNFFAQNLREVSANLVKNFDTVIHLSKSRIKQLQSRISNYSCGYFKVFNLIIFYDKKVQIHSKKPPFWYLIRIRMEHLISV